MNSKEPTSARYADGSADLSIVEEPFSNGAPAIHALISTPDTRLPGLGLEARIIRKIAGTLGYHRTAIVFDPDRAGAAEDDEHELCSSRLDTE